MADCDFGLLGLLAGGWVAAVHFPFQILRFPHHPADLRPSKWFCAFKQTLRRPLLSLTSSPEPGFSRLPMSRPSVNFPSSKFTYCRYAFAAVLKPGAFRASVFKPALIAVAKVKVKSFTNFSLRKVQVFRCSLKTRIGRSCSCERKVQQGLDSQSPKPYHRYASCWGASTESTP